MDKVWGITYCADYSSASKRKTYKITDEERQKFREDVERPEEPESSDEDVQVQPEFEGVEEEAPGEGEEAPPVAPTDIIRIEEHHHLR